jgi:hypothetical protein
LKKVGKKETKGERKNRERETEESPFSDENSPS